MNIKTYSHLQHLASRPSSTFQSISPDLLHLKWLGVQQSGISPELQHPQDQLVLASIYLSRVSWLVHLDAYMPTCRYMCMCICVHIGLYV